MLICVSQDLRTHKGKGSAMRSECTVCIILRYVYASVEINCSSNLS